MYYTNPETRIPTSSSPLWRVHPHVRHRLLRRLLRLREPARSRPHCDQLVGFSLCYIIDLVKMSETPITGDDRPGHHAGDDSPAIPPDQRATKETAFEPRPAAVAGELSQPSRDESVTLVGRCAAGTPAGDAQLTPSGRPDDSVRMFHPSQAPPSSTRPIVTSDTGGSSPLT